MSTPTPRTDAAQFWDRSDYHDPSVFDWFVRAEHARTLERELIAEREKVQSLRNALQSLHDEQNGAPLRRRRDHWQMAMNNASSVLAATEDTP